MSYQDLPPDYKLVAGAVLIGFVIGVMVGQWFSTLGMILGFGPR